jgi:hypothetical protein
VGTFVRYFVTGLTSFYRKLAVVADDDPISKKRAIYAFQFRRKEMVDGFVKALRAGSDEQKVSKTDPRRRSAFVHPFSLS